jgi:hypothetical protein
VFSVRLKEEFPAKGERDGCFVRGEMGLNITVNQRGARWNAENS